MNFLFKLFYPLNLLVLIWLIIYRYTFSLLWRNCCRFYPSCSHYATDAYKKFNFFFATYIVIVRLVKCHPYYQGDCH